MLVGVGDEGGARIDSSTFSALQDSIPYRDTCTGRIQTHSFSTVFIVTPETGLDRKHTVNIEGLLVGNQHSANGKPPSSPKNVRTVLQP